MELEAVRIVADFLKHPDLGVNTRLAAVPRDAGDPAPKPFTVYDRTRDPWAARLQYSPELKLAFPALVVVPFRELKMQGEVMTTYRDGYPELLIAAIDKDPDAAAAVEGGLYGLRAVQQTLRALHDPANVAHRTRNSIVLAVSEDIRQLSPAMLDVALPLIGALVVKYRARDLAP